MGRRQITRYCEARGVKVGEVQRLLKQRDGQVRESTTFINAGEMSWLDRELGVAADAEVDEESEPDEGTGEDERFELLADPLCSAPADLPPARRRVWVHLEDVFGEIEGRQAVTRRASLVLRHLAAYGRSSIVKGTRGNENRGWRRTPLGGSGGSQFYLWWAPQGAPPTRGLGLESGSILARAVRHHDDHRPLTCEDLDECFELGDSLLGDDHLCPQPWTEEQTGFLRDDAHLRLLRGAAGTGKTTALFDVICTRRDDRVLFVTYSNELVTQCLQYGRAFSTSRSLEAISFPDLVRRIPGSHELLLETEAHRAQFVETAERLGPQLLGPWTRHLDWLHGEMRAHLLGHALPVPCLERPACVGLRLSDDLYRELRRPELGDEAVGALLRVARRLESQELLEEIFPQVVAARRALDRLITADEDGSIIRNVGLYDRLVVDEIQDLTFVEVYLLIELLVRMTRRRDGVPPFLALSGDESQTVAPTGFRWSWLQRLLRERFGPGIRERKLSRNVRSPGVIGELVNRSRVLYSRLDDSVKPRGDLSVEVTPPTCEEVYVCLASEGDEARALLRRFDEMERAVIVSLTDEPPSELPEGAECLSPAQVKGLEFQTVCLVGLGAQIAAITDPGSGYWRRDDAVVPLWKRTAIDRLRVALSRATETLILLELRPDDDAVRALEQLLDFDPESSGERIVPDLFSPPELIAHLTEEASREERVHGFVTDAVQLAEAAPAEAIRKARQARALLGRRGSAGSVADETLRRDAVLTLARLIFQRALTEAASDAGHALELLDDAEKQLTYLDERRLLAAFRTVRRAVMPRTAQLRARAMRDLGSMTTAGEWEPPEWFTVALAPAFSSWLPELEATIASAAKPLEAARTLAPCYRIAGLSHEVAHQRTQAVLDGAARQLLSRRKYAEALEIATTLDAPPYDVIGSCYERTRRRAEAAQAFREGGLSSDALRNARAAGDLEATLELLDLIDDEVPARESLEWLREVAFLADDPPGDLETMYRPDERKLLRKLLAEVRGQVVDGGSHESVVEYPLLARAYVEATSWRDEDAATSQLALEDIPGAVDVPALGETQVRCFEPIPVGPGQGALVWLDAMARALARRPAETPSMLTRQEKNLLARSLRTLHERAFDHTPNDVDVESKISKSD